MTDLGLLRRYFTKAAWVLGSVSALSALYLLFPVGASTAEAKADLDLTTLNRIDKEKEVVPLRGIQEKLAHSQKDARDFYRERLASRNSVIFDELGKMARENGVTLSTGKYDSKDSEIPGLTLVELEVQVSGFYPQLAKFIHAVEQSKRFYMIDGLTLADLKTGTVKLDLQVETYLRPTGVIDQGSGTKAESAPATLKRPAAAPRKKAEAKP